MSLSSARQDRAAAQRQDMRYGCLGRGRSDACDGGVASLWWACTVMEWRGRRDFAQGRRCPDGDAGRVLQPAEAPGPRVCSPRQAAVEARAAASCFIASSRPRRIWANVLFAGAISRSKPRKC